MTKMVWELSDGTTVTSDGETITVSGGSRFAKALRSRLTEAEYIDVPIDPQPGWERLTPSRAYNVDAWIAYVLRVDGGGVLVTSRPEFEPPPPLPPGKPGQVY